MAIPDFQSIMLPLLRLAGDGQEHHLSESRETLARHFGLSKEELRQLLPSGRQPIFDNRVAWAKSYLKQAGLLDTPRRAVFKITPRGQNILSSGIQAIDIPFLEQYPEFVQFRYGSRDQQGQAHPTSPEPEEMLPSQTPDELMDAAYQKLRSELAQEILDQIKGCSPAFFERTVVDLLLAMGYGGSRREAGATIGKSGDGGIDGIIKEDKLGLDVVYIQAKRWDAGTVGRPDIQKFAGALQGQRAKKGVFITTSAFTKEAREFASFIDTRIVLIDGEQLAQLMIDHGVGVTTTTVYELKRLDSDYFAEG